MMLGGTSSGSKTSNVLLFALNWVRGETCGAASVVVTNGEDGGGRGGSFATIAGSPRTSLALCSAVVSTLIVPDVKRMNCRPFMLQMSKANAPENIAVTKRDE